MALGLAGVDGLLESGANLRARQPGQLFAIALPEGFEHHPVGRLRPFDETGDVEARIGRDDRADAARGTLLVDEGARFRRARRHVGRDERRLGFGLGLGTGDRLLLVTRPLPEDGIEPKAHEEGDHGQQDDFDGQPISPGKTPLT